MALPKNNSAWPPKPFDIPFKDIAEWQVWWEGTSPRLQNYMLGRANAPAGLRQRTGAAVDAFMGKGASQGATEQRIHLPVASDIFRLGASMLYATPPTFKVAVKTEDKAQEAVEGEELETVVEDTGDTLAQERLDLLANNPKFHSHLLVGAESCAALGGQFIRVVWDAEVRPDQAWLDFVDADHGIPEFMWGYLTAVTFWNDIPGKDDVMFRHLQRYERGFITHALYEGSVDNIGHVIPLAEHPETLGLTEGDNAVDAYGRVATGAPDDIAAVYVPNRRPNPKWRNDPQLKMLGHSDITMDLIPILTAIDEVWTSLMRDVRQGKGRMVVSENLLELIGPGKGSRFNLDQEIFSPVAESMDDEGKPVIEQVQFEIREGAHLTVIEALVTEVLRRTGISPITFGLGDPVAGTTATEIEAHTRDTINTTKTKRRLWEPELAHIITVLLRVDAEKFMTGVELEEPIEVLWPEVVQIGDEERARTVALMEQAKAASLTTKIKTLHPEWDDGQVLAEKLEIKDDQTAAMPVMLDPFAEGESGGAENDANASDTPNADDDTNEE